MIPAAIPVAATAIPVGIAFGVILERAGLGDARVIAGQLVLRDFTVIRVMFGAIVTAMLGLLWGDALGWIDLSTMAIPPTDLAAQALGAVIFGGGFSLAALCPGTACVAAASGRRDGLVAVAGVFLGTVVTPVLWPVLGPSTADVPREGAQLPSDLGWPTWTVVLVITALGIVASMIARRVEKRPTADAWWKPSKVEAIALTLAVAFAATDARTPASRARLASLAGEIAREEDHVDPLDLATWIREGRAGLRLIDVREGLDTSVYVIPGARNVPLRDIASLEVKPGEHVVLYSDGGAHAAQAWVLLRARGLTDVRVLKDGMAAWEDEVLSPEIPTSADDSTQRRFRRARELSLWFGGRPRLSATPAPSLPAPSKGASPPTTSAAAAGADAPRPVPEARRRRRNTC